MGDTGVTVEEKRIKITRFKDVLSFDMTCKFGFGNSTEIVKNVCPSMLIGFKLINGFNSSFTSTYKF